MARGISCVYHSIREVEVVGLKGEKRPGEGEEEEEEDEENEEGGSRLRSTLARAVSAGLMVVTSRSWPDEILRLDREKERVKGEGRRKRSYREKKKNREGEDRRKRGRGRRCPEEEVGDEEEEVEGTRCESSALTLGFDARP